MVIAVKDTLIRPEQRIHTFVHFITEVPGIRTSSVEHATVVMIQDIFLFDENHTQT